MSDTPELYRPSNGTEGEDFFDSWCRRCARDRAMREGLDVDDCDDNERCDLIARSFAHDIDEPEYPQEWIVDENGNGRCTAFIPAGEAVVDRCPHTTDMFSDRAKEAER